MKIKKTNLLVIAVLLLASVLGGCATAEKTSVEKGYTVADSQERIVEFEAAPSKVVSLAPNITEIIFALGKESALAGRTDWCNYPESVSGYESVGNMDIPDVEKIISLKPDVVLLSEITKKEIAEQLEASGVPYFVVDNEESFEGSYSSIRMVAGVLGASEKAEEIITGMKEKVAMIQSKVEGVQKPKVYYVMGYGEYGDFTAGKGTFISQMIAMAGGINVADDTEGWAYSVEKVMEHNPDILLCSVFAPPAGLKEAAGYKNLQAVRDDRMYVIDDDSLQRLGPRLADALYSIAKALHPGLFE